MPDTSEVEQPILVLDDEQIAENSQEKKSKKGLFVIISLVVLILLLAAVLLALILSKKKSVDVEATMVEEPKVSVQQFKSKKLDLMIAKANTLYESGDKTAALALYEKIASFNESFSHYNLGVSKMHEGNYEDALKSFEKALSERENSTVAALNAAVCALELKDDSRFEYYIDLAYANLAQEKDSSLYYYYLGLINYYKGFYPEALQALSKDIHPLYQNSANYLRAKIYALLDNSAKAIRSLHAQDKYDKNLSLGYLYSRRAEFNKAKFYFENAIERHVHVLDARLALSLVNIKLANFKKAASELNLLLNDSDWLDKQYGIKTVIDDRIFDINYAQKNYEANFLNTKKQKYDLIFYFSPFMIFDANASKNLINKGSVNVFLNDFDSSKEYLNASSKLANINKDIAHALYLAYTHNIKQASEELLLLSQKYAQHSILQYNLALTYALLGKYELAREHFLASYHLDPNNFKAGIYALFCYDILELDGTKYEQEISFDLERSPNSSEKIYLQALLSLKNNNYKSAKKYLDSSKENTLSELALEIILLHSGAESEKLIERAKLLIDMSNNDIIANILFFSLKNKRLNIKSYAKDIQIHFLNRKLDYRALIGGAKIVGENYVKLMQVSGLIQQERKKLKIYLKNHDDVGALRALAYIDIYAKEFEESHAIYNNLIDDYKIDDSDTLFLAAVSAIGAGHNNLAVALLELARVQDNENLEARLALALLYLEARNYQSAITQLEKLNDGYKSEFFTFQIDKKRAD